MRQLYYLLSIFRPIFSYLFLIGGSLGTIYCYGTEKGDIATVAFLLLAIAGLIMFISEEFQGDESLSEHFGGAGKRGSRKHKRAGKRCPQCQKIIYHRRTVCQHCGYEFPSHNYGKKDEETVPPAPAKGPDS